MVNDFKDLSHQFASNQFNRDFDQVAEPLSFTVFHTSDDKDRSTTDLNGHFIHSQLLLDCLIRMKCLSSDKNDLISRIQKEYQGNVYGLSILNEFQEHYSSDQAIWWYTRAPCLYRILNKALRIQDIELLFLFRFFIRDIQVQLHQHQYHASSHVYRGQLISNEELQILKESKEQFISINSFLSTSASREVALAFVTGFTSSTDIQPVLFEIQIDSQVTNSKPFANITSLSCFPIEEEVLFMPGSIYRIVYVVYEETLWIIRMNLSSNHNYELKSVFEYMRNQYGNGERDLLSLGAVLYDMGKFVEAEKYYHRLLNDQFCDKQVIRSCYHAFGSIALEKGDYESSLEWNHKLLQIYTQKQHIDHLCFAHCYNSIGVAYQKKDDYKHALSSYETALMIWKYVFGENHPKIAMGLNNLGGVYHAMKQYPKALECHQKALTIWQIHLPANCPDLGAAHNNLGCVYGCLNQLDDAMKHYNLSLEIYQKSLPVNHPANAKTLENIALIHYLKNEYEESLEFYTKAACVYRRALPSTHPKLSKIEKDIENVWERKMPSSFHFWWLDNLKMPSSNDLEC